MSFDRLPAISRRRCRAGALACFAVLLAWSLADAATAGTAPAASAAAGQVPAGDGIVMALWQDGHEIARAGDQPVTLAAAKEGDVVKLAVMVSGARTFRSFEVHLFYDAAGLEYTGWELDKALSTALSITPGIFPDQNRAVFVAALPRPITLNPAEPLHIGDAGFIVRDPTHVRAAIIYMEMLDDNMVSTSRGTKPVVVKADPERRMLGDGIWWTLARPNPFAYLTTVSFSTPDSMFVTLNVIDTQGKLLRPLVADTYRGRYSTTWAGTAFSGERVKYGEYIITFEAGGKADSQVVKMVDPAELTPRPH